MRTTNLTTIDSPNAQSLAQRLKLKRRLSSLENREGERFKAIVDQFPKRSSVELFYTIAKVHLGEKEVIGRNPNGDLYLIGYILGLTDSAVAHIINRARTHAETQRRLTNCPVQNVKTYGRQEWITLEAKRIKL